MRKLFVVVGLATVALLAKANIASALCWVSYDICTETHCCQAYGGPKCCLTYETCDNTRGGVPVQECE